MEGKTRKDILDVGRYIKLIAFDIAMALLIVILYSPGLLALSPADPGVIRPGIAICAAIFIVAGLVYANGKALFGKDKPVEKQFAKGEAKADTLAAALSRLSKTFKMSDLSQVAANGASEARAVQKKESALVFVLSEKFEPGTMTYNRFHSAVKQASSTVTDNLTTLANKLYAFDEDDYSHTMALLGSGEYRFDNIPDDIQEEKGRLMAKTMADMNAIIAANEKLLLELDKFAMELGNLDAAGADAESAAMIAEIKELTEQAKYYETALRD